MAVIAVIIVIFIYYFGFSQERDRKRQHTLDLYNSAVKLNQLSYYDARIKKQRDVKYHLFVQDMERTDKNGNKIRYILLDYPERPETANVVVDAMYWRGEHHMQKVNLPNDWLTDNGYITLKQFKNQYHPWWMANVDI